MAQIVRSEIFLQAVLGELAGNSNGSSAIAEYIKPIIHIRETINKLPNRRLRRKEGREPIHRTVFGSTQNVGKSFSAACSVSAEKHNFVTCGRQRDGNSLSQPRT